MGRLMALLALGLALGCEAGTPERVLEGGRDFAVRDMEPAGPLDRGLRDAGPPRDRGAPDAEPGADAAPVDAAPADADAVDAGPVDAALPADAAPDDTVAVGHPRELRGVWIATVYNINFPARATRDPAGQQARLRTLLDVAQEAGLNAVFFQVRPEGDAFWPSERAPFSRFLTGTQGEDPGYDPLAVLVREAHARGLQVHAWFNPFRGAVDPARPLHASHPAARFPQHAHPYRGQIWLDPGAAEVRADFVATVAEAVRGYALDGVHFDDYVYPYPDQTDFPDGATWQAYQAGGGALGRADWRRDNVLQLMRAVQAAVRAEDPDVMFGVSPFGIYRPGTPPGISGLDQYASLYSDPVAWMAEGVMDYVAPQLYWNASRPQQDYETLLTWWCGLAGDGRFVLAGNYLSELGSAAAWDLAEFARQIGISRALAPAGSLGNIFFQIEPLEANRAGVRDVFAAEHYAQPAWPPPVPGRGNLPVEPPTLARTADGLQVDHPDRDALAAFALYGPADGGWRLQQIVPADAAIIAVGAGRWAVSALRRGGAESRGRLAP